MMSSAKRALLEAIGRPVTRSQKSDQHGSHKGVGQDVPSKQSPKTKVAGWMKKTFSPFKERVAEMSRSLLGNQMDAIQSEGSPEPPPRAIIYEAPQKGRKRKGVRFGGYPGVREQVTRAGRVTKIPSKFRN
jgi:hypothetical protein